MASLAGPPSSYRNAESYSSYVESESWDSPQERPESRSGIVNYLRRSRSREETNRSGKPQRKLTRKRAKSLSKETAPADMVPSLPMHANTSNFHVPLQSPYPNNNNNNSVNSSTAGPVTYYSYHQHNNPPPVTPPRSGYNPNTFYQRYLNMDRADASPSVASTIPVPPIPASPAKSQDEDALSRTESIANRGRYSYASNIAGGTINSPRRVRRRKDPTPLNVLIVGTKNCGKTSFIKFLQSALAQPIRNRQTQSPSPPPTSIPRDQNSPFVSHYLETELEGERIGLTLYDSNGLERPIIDLQLRELSSFFETKFQETFYEEQKVLRATGIRDTHIHCVFLLLDPVRLDLNLAAAGKNAPNGAGMVSTKQRVNGSLDEDLDVDLLRMMQGKTTVIPVISKADTITTAHMTYLKRSVSETLKKLKIDPLEALSLDSDDESEYDTASSAMREGASEDDAISSMYGDAREGDVIDNLAENSTSKSFPNGRNTEDGVTKSGNLFPPQHDEIRVSTLSENLDLPPLPLSIISPDMYDPGVVGRRFPWGFADPYNTEHCDFVRLKESVFSEWRSDLREAARERWYEGWRTSRLKRRGQGNGTNGSMTAMNTGRSVSGAAAYGGKGPEHSLKPPSTVNGPSRAVSASDIGVAVSNGISAPPIPRSYRGVGTY